MRRSDRQKRQQDDDSPVKILFGLYQCLHHLSILTSGAGTGKRQIFSRKVEELDRFFVPAMSAWNPTFLKNCHATNERWRQQQISNLREHYEYCTQVLEGSIFALHLTNSERIKLLGQTKKWAMQMYRKKFQANIFEKVDQMVQKIYQKHEKTTETASKSRGVRTERTVKGIVPGNSKAGISDRRATGSGPVSTPKRKRNCSSSGPSSPQSSPTQIQTPKRSKNSISYSQKAKSPPTFRPNANTQKNNPAVTKFPNLKRNQHGLGMHNVWHVPKVEKDTLILGDSNLARVSFVKRRDAQVVSYPGLNLRKMTSLLENFKFGHKSDNPGRKPSHVVFSVGLNDRGCAPSTSEISLTKLMNRAQQEFPGSKISFYKQPFDLGLKTDEKLALKSLNNAIETKCKAKSLNCIPALPESKFKVAGRNDMIHWSEDCANATIDHIFDHLN